MSTDTCDCTQVARRQILSAFEVYQEPGLEHAAIERIVFAVHDLIDHIDGKHRHEG
jgi:hypothetical protein